MKRVMRALPVLLFAAACVGGAVLTFGTAQAGQLLHNSNAFPGTTKWGGNWGTATGQYGAFDCTTCHTQSTTNIKRIKTTVNAPSGTFPGGANSPVVFTNVTGMGNDRTAHTTSARICEACHSQNKYHNYNSANNTGGNTHNNMIDCTGCHPHDKGFQPQESTGGQACSSCHNATTLYSTMNSDTTTYHHRMQSDTATYPTNPTPADTDKRCLQCHADHNIFRSDLNTANTIGRAANFRVNVTVTPTQTAPGTTYTNTDFVSSDADGGLCLSCHKNLQVKDQTYQKPDGTTKTPIIPFSGGSKTDFQNSVHSYQVSAKFTTDGSTYSPNCSKCHNGTFANNYQAYATYTTAFNNHASSDRRIAAALGQTTIRDPQEERLCYRCHAKITDNTGSNVKRVAGKDWYNRATMSTSAEAIFGKFSTTTNPYFKHPVKTSTLHKPYDEGQGANDGTLSGANRHVDCQDCHNPHASQPVASGILTGTLSSYTNGGTTANDTLTVAGTPWAVNAYVGWTVKIVGGTGAGSMSVIFSNTANTLSAKFATSGAALDSTSKFIIFKRGTTDGNLIGNTQAGAWGINPTWVSQTPPAWNDGAGLSATTADSTDEITGQFATITAWNRSENATTQGAVCIKCHSAYAYGTTPPAAPEGAPTGSSSASSNTTGLTMKEGDKANEFSTTNLGYHPIFARGMNQPVRANFGNTALKSAVNTAWPKYSAGTIAISNGVATLTSATLPATALPGWFVYIGATGPTAGATTGASNQQTAGTSTTGYLEITSITSSTQFNVRTETGGTWPNVTYSTTPTVASTSSWFLTAGLGNNFVPPWGPWSTMKCTDCHQSDTTTDPMGPHGSATKYLLIRATAQTFSYWNGSAVVGTTNTPTDADNFCVNCHRRDVYGDYNTAGANPTWSRQAHPIDATGTARSLAKKPAWGPVCMNCHGGARSGAIHGLNLGKGGAAGSYSGKRLLSGAMWYGVTRSTYTTAGTCYTKSSSTDAVSNCGNTSNGTFTGSGGPSGTAGTAQYQFDDSTP